MSLGKKIAIAVLVGLLLVTLLVYLLSVAVTTKQKRTFVLLCIIFLVLNGLCVIALSLLWLAQPRSERDYEYGLANAIKIGAGLFAFAFIIVCLALLAVSKATSIGIPFTAARALYVAGVLMVLVGSCISGISEIRVS